MNFRPHKFPIVNILGEINTSPLLFHTCAHTYIQVAPFPFLLKWCCTKELLLKEEAELC